MASFSQSKFAFLVLAIALVLAPSAEAITCGNVVGSLGSCIAYLRSTGTTGVPPGCCSGIKALNNAARTTPDRQIACNCIKRAANSIRGINYGLAGSLPGKCGVSIPYKISPNTDCTKVK